MSRRALIVDDDPSLAELFREAVGSSGIDVLTQTRCDAAASCLSKEKFDVVLLGLHMPALDGIDLTRQIRSAGINRMTPIIVVSDDQQSSAVALAFEAGASFFLYKPVDKARLLKLIRATQGSIENERRRFRRIPCHVKVRLATEAESFTAKRWTSVSTGYWFARRARFRIKRMCAWHFTFRVTRSRCWRLVP